MAKNNGEATLLLKIKEQGAEILDKLKGSYLGLTAAVTALATAIGFSIKNYSEAEEASNKLSLAIKNQGLNVDTVKRQYTELAEVLEKKSVYDGDELVAALAIGQAMAGKIRLTDELIKATVDYASATGTDLNSAFEKVGKSIGTTTNAFRREGIEISESASASEKMAQITDVLNSKFEGQAELMSKSANGAIKQFWVSLGNLSEVLGGFLSPAVIATTRALTGLINGFRELVQGRFVLNLSEQITKAYYAFDLFVEKAALGVRALAGLAKQAFGAMRLDKGMIEEGKAMVEQAKAEEFKLEKDHKRKVEELEDQYNARRAGAYIDTEKRLRETLQKQHKTYLTDKQKSDQEAMDKELKKDRAAAAKAVEDFKEFEWKKVEASEAARKKYIEEWKKGMAKAGQFTETAITGGVQGATQKILTEVTENLIPGFGGAAGQMFSLLSQDSDKFLETINTLFSVKFLDNIASNIPILITKFADALPGIVDKFNEKIPEIVETLIESIIENSPRMAVAFSQAFNKPEFYERMVLAIANGFANGVRDGFGRGFAGAENSIAWHFEKGFVGGVSKGLDQLGQRIRDLLTVNVGGIAGGGGGPGGVVGQVAGAVGRAVGLAHGGVVQPIYAAGGTYVPRGTDTVPAMLTPGEYVMNAAATARNRSALESMNNGGSGGGMNVSFNFNGPILGDAQMARQFAIEMDRELLKLRQLNQSVSFDKSTF